MSKLEAYTMKNKKLNIYSSITDSHKLAIKKWWEAFQKHHKYIISSLSQKGSGYFDLPSWMNKHLQSINPRLMWEFGPGIKKKHRLIITPESYAELRPLVRYLLEQSPCFAQWEFYEYRLPESFEETLITMQQRVGWIYISDIRFQLSIGKFNQIDCKFYLPFPVEEKNAKGNLFILLETLLGEEILDKWVGLIKVEQPKKNIFNRMIRSKNKEGADIRKLKSDFNMLIESVKSEYSRPYHTVIEKAEWSLMEMQPKEQEDYLDKQDLFVSPFIAGRLFPATCEGKQYFYSERFSNNKEIFLYIKIDGTAEDFNQGIFQDRASMEDALGKLLSKDEIGCVVGGGTGIRYYYTDLAVTDFERSLEVIKNTLQKGKLTKRSWILFHDADLQSEWIGVYPDSPKPPM